MVIEFENETRVYYNPPSWFIPEIVVEFYQRYRYYKTFGSAPSYDDQNQKFIYLWNEYENSLSKYMKQVQENG